MGCVFLMVLVSLLPHAAFGPNDYRERAPHFIVDSTSNISEFTRMLTRIPEKYHQFNHSLLIKFEKSWMFQINLPRPKGNDLLPEFSEFRIGPDFYKALSDLERLSDETHP